MVQEVLSGLDVTRGGSYCDATVGFGGHAQAILDATAPAGRLAGIDRDLEALTSARGRLRSYGDRVSLCHGNFADVVDILRDLGMIPVDGLLVDLGISSSQIDRADRGFSFAEDGPLDMRMDQCSGPRAVDLIARLTEEQLAEVIREFGEEPSSRRIARAIKTAQASGELDGTRALAEVVTSALRGRPPRRGSHIHPATRTFMALRMAVNDELGSLHRFLDTFTEALRPGGRVAIISFHSMEDRAVKRRFAEMADPCTCPPRLPVCACGLKPSLSVITRRPLRPAGDELERNPRARSARLRIAEKLP
jgi:16S rRNA (cytosine1402-N4)-methyltransferase